MARTSAERSQGTRVTDSISLGVVADRIPAVRVREVLREEARESQRVRKMPAHIVVYCVIALSLFRDASYGEVLRRLLEGLEGLGQPIKSLRKIGRSAISQARSRLGAEPMQRLYRELVQPVATEKTRGAWYQSPNQTNWIRRLVSIDGSTLDVADEEANEAAFGRPSAAHGKSGFPKIRFVSLAECGTHVLFGAADGPYTMSETELARSVLPKLTPEMLCIADRGFGGYDLWKEAAATGADLLWRFKVGVELPRLRVLPDGSYLSRLYPSPADRKRDCNGIDVRVVEYVLRDELGNKRPIEDRHYRLVTTILDPDIAPATDLAALYHERWEIETAFDEFKTHLRGRAAVLRSKTPELVRQEFYGLLLAHYVIRALMHEAALKAKIDPDEVSFVHSANVVRRRIKSFQRALKSAQSSERIVRRR